MPATYEDKYRRSVEDPGGLLARGSPADRLDQALHQGQGKPASRRRISASAGSGTARSTCRPIASTGIWPTRGDQLAIIWEPDDPATPGRTFTYRELHEAICRFANVLKANGVEKRRPGHYLSADDPRSGGGHARLRADRRGPFDRVRRLLARSAGRADRRLRPAPSSSPPTKGCAAARRFRSRPMSTMRWNIMRKVVTA